MSEKKKNGFLRYALLPEVVPRLGDLLGSGFSSLALFMAYLFGGIRLLPATHPYLHHTNAGKFGVRHVIAEAYRNLTFKKEHIDQIIIFFTLVIGLVLLGAQFFLLVFAILIQTASAQSAGAMVSNSPFSSSYPVENDIAFNLLDRVFGVPGIFRDLSGQGTAVANGEGGLWPTAYHEGMHSLFSTYNIGVAAIGVIIFLYYVVTIVAETASTGTPFGKRFNKAMVPIRFILALGLLIPVSYGLNVAQVVTLNVAKLGSNFATHGWSTFMYGAGVTASEEQNNLGPFEMDFLAGNPMSQDSNMDDNTVLGKKMTLVGTPSPPQLGGLAEFLFVARTCMHVEAELRNYDVKPYVVKGNVYRELDGMDFSDVVDFYKNENKDFQIRFGTRDTKFEGYQSSIAPLCGELTMSQMAISEPGARHIRQCYFHLVKTFWDDPGYDEYAQNVVKRIVPTSIKDPTAALPDNNKIREMRRFINSKLTSESEDSALVWAPEHLECNNILEQAQQKQIGEGDWQYKLHGKGWAGAGIWYNNIAIMNGAITAAAMNVPSVRYYPMVMEYVAEEKQKESGDVGGAELYNPSSSTGEEVTFNSDEEKYIAEALYSAKALWNEDADETNTGNVFVNSIISLFGLNGLFNLRDNINVNPLAQLSIIGRGFIESAIINFGIAFGSTLGAGAMNFFDSNVMAQFINQIGNVSGQIAMIGLSMGFVMYYIIPFLPFMYFFIAVGGWVKALFEAMVAMPLWALAHLRIDGDGIPGQAAANGYFLLLEIFLRPVLIIVGLIGGITVFTAEVLILNEIWDFVGANLGAFDDVSDPGFWEHVQTKVNQFFFMVMYAIVVYMMATSSFKMADLVPKNILRWMGSSIDALTEEDQDPAGRLVSTSYIGVSQVTGQLKGAFGSFGGLLLRNK